ncbi:MAG: prepilin-type N-terminal cleavage/methylation domain-containing protein [Candidatus Riflebacteria bacterium]|nr:prepilin-type N-terminal cleavage/methylation domain-containing protein [Candidatus Riflebacteria bacterium]
MKKQKGFTLVEILVAASILSFLLVSVFMIFRELTTSYRIGEWRTSRQKDLQLLLLALKEDLEKANSAYIIKSTGIADLVTPELSININTKAFNAAESGTNKIASNNTNQSVAYFAILKSAVEASEFSGLTSGKWQGCSLVLMSRSLTYMRTGDYNRHSTFPISMPGAVFTAPDSGVIAGGMFEPEDGNNFYKTLDDVASLSFYLIEDGDKRALRVIVECQLLKNNLPASSITESTVARIMRDTKVNSTGM